MFLIVICLQEEWLKLMANANFVQKIAILAKMNLIIALLAKLTCFCTTICALKIVLLLTITSTSPMNKACVLSRVYVVNLVIVLPLKAISVSKTVRLATITLN